MRCFYLILLSVFSTGFSIAQNAIGTYQLWFDYDYSQQIKQRTTAYGDIGFRTLFPNDWYRIYIRPGIRFSHKPLLDIEKSPLEYHFGIGTFFTINILEENSLEIRPYQGLKIKYPNLEHMLFDHYFRIEERIELNVGNTENEFGFRGRYKIRVFFTWKEDQLDRGFSYPLSLEIFANLNKSLLFNDVFRLSGGVDYRQNRIWSGRFELSYHRTNNTAVGGQVTNDLIFRFRFYQRIIHKKLNKL